MMMELCQIVSLDVGKNTESENVIRDSSDLVELDDGVSNIDSVNGTTAPLSVSPFRSLLSTFVSVDGE